MSVNRGDLDQRSRNAATALPATGTRIQRNALSQVFDRTFVAILAIDKGLRSAGHGWHAIREFMQRARETESASWIELRLDEVGNVDSRRASFERMGFQFDGVFGSARIENLSL